MITRTTKYTASDGTEHDSPQAAAACDLQEALIRAAGIGRLQTQTTTRYLARNPEALRDAVNAYFEDLEAHPDVKPAMVLADYDRFVEIPREEFERGTKPERPYATDNRICAICDGGPGNNCACTCGMKKWIEPDPKADNRTGDPDDPSTWRDKPLSPMTTSKQMLEHGYAVRAKCDGEHFPPACKDPQCWHKQPLDDGEIAPGVRGFEMEVPKGSNVAMDYASGSDWSAGAVVYKPAPLGDPDDPSTWAVDHPQYCRPFGTRED